jgi:hypothetical protein
MSTAIAAAGRDAQQQVLHSANAGVIVERVGQVRARRLGPALAAALAEAAYVNEHHADLASVLLFEEAFGTKNRMHWLIHARSLETYEACFRTTRGAGLAGGPESGQGSSRDADFVDGTLSETVMLPQFTGMYGTSMKGQDVPDRQATFGTPAVVPPAQHQVETAPENTLNSVTAGAIIHRSGQLRYEFRGEGRQFARDVAAAINSKYGGDVVVFLYEEAFGPADRIHWLIHLRCLSTYYALIDGHAWATEADREVYSRQRVAPEKGGGDWSRLFVEAGLRDVVLSRILADGQPSSQSRVAVALEASGADA